MRIRWRGLTPLLLLLFFHDVGAAANWPIEPRDATHPIGNSAGELHFNGNAFHNGIDIMEDKYSPNGHLVVTKDQGTIIFVSPRDCGQKCEYLLVLPDANQTTQMYLHLASESMQFSQADPNTVIPAGTYLGQVVQWKGCSADPDRGLANNYYHHLHFEIYGKSGQLEPVLSLDPKAEGNNDLAGPFIEEVLITTDDSLGPPTTIPKGPKMPVLKDKVDIVVKAYDRQFVSTNQNHKTGVLKIEYHLSGTHGEAPLDKHGNRVMKNGSMIDFSTVPLDSSLARVFYGSVSPIQSRSNYCKPDEAYYYVVTNADPTDASKSNPGYSLDTTQYANGLYIVWVKVWDTSGNEAHDGFQIKIQNP